MNHFYYSIYQEFKKRKSFSKMEIKSLNTNSTPINFF